VEKAVFGVAKSETQAIAICDDLKNAGSSNNDVSVLLPENSRNQGFAHEQHTKEPEGAATGAGTGAVLGGAFGWRMFRLITLYQNGKRYAPHNLAAPSCSNLLRLRSDDGITPWRFRRSVLRGLEPTMV
jgi:hypothetical protein